jgi:LysR family transcriptional regulator, transcriptional activator of nhaA
MKSLNYNHLFYFYLVVREGGVSQAARKINVTQPALSAQMRQLETTLGRKLFLRAGRTVKPTAFGKVVYGFARQMFEIAQELQDEVTKTIDSMGPRIQIGVCDDLEKPWAVDVISEFLKSKEADKKPHVTLVTGSHDSLERKLRNHNVDVVFTNQSVFDEEVDILDTVQMPVMLGLPGKVASEETLIKAADAGDMRELLKILDMRLVMPSKLFKLRYEIEDYLENERVSLRIAFEADLLTAVVRAVRDGVGASFLPLPYMSAEVAAGEISVFGPKEGFWRHKLFLLYGKKGYVNPLVYEVQAALAKFKAIFEAPLTSSEPLVENQPEQLTEKKTG